MSVSLTPVLEFLSFLHESKKSFSTVNVHRSMLSSTLPAIDGYTVGTHPLVKNLLSGCYNLNPPRPRYDFSWDPAVVFAALTSWGDNESLSLMDLSRKSVILLALASFLRVSEIANIAFHSLNFFDTGLSFSLFKPRKAQRSGPLQTISLSKFMNQTICPVQTISSYVNKTQLLRSHQTEKDHLFIGVTTPHRAVSSSTLSRWIKSVLSSAGVDTTVFSGHSTRSAAASSASRKAVPLDLILSKGN